MRQSLSKIALWMCFMLLVASCARPSTPNIPPPSSQAALSQTPDASSNIPPTSTAVPTVPATAIVLPATPAPTQLPPPTSLPLPPTLQDVAWLWLPKADSAHEYFVPFWRAGVPVQIPDGNLVAVTSSGQQHLLGENATDIIYRFNNYPLATLQLSTTNRLALVDPATGAVVSDRQIERGGILAPDGTQFAARIPIPSPPDQFLNAIQIANLTTGVTSTIDVFDNYSLRYTNVLLEWGPYYIYGATHDRWIHALWWIDPNAANPRRQEFYYGENAVELVFNAQTDTIVYSWMPDNFTSSVITTALMLHNTLTDEQHVIDTGTRFTNLALSPNGQYLVCLHKEAEDSITSELRLYDVTHQGS
ncbi:MAG TPA: hypothetical protein VFT66_00040, partial [Roseiflexaceae bacterium]|nr:hypothetical protein [Roseiflexaceae bacterium]